MRSAVIAGTGRSLPGRVLTNKELEAMVDTSDEWIVARTGIRERRIAGPEEKLSLFAIEAAGQALVGAGVDAVDVDMIVCATVTPDRPIPATACTIQHELGAQKAAAFDLSAGCSGFIYALHIAKMAVVSGDYRNVLVIGAELLSKHTDWADRGTCVIFADGAGAVVVNEGEAPRGIGATALHADGSMLDFITLPAGGSEQPITHEAIERGDHLIKMKGNETFKIAVRQIEEVSREVLEKEGLTPADVDLFIPHQANQRIIDAVGHRLGVDAARTLVNIDRYGNTSAGSIPIALDEAVREGRLRRGDRVLLAAFGAGLTSGASVVRW